MSQAEHQDPEAHYRSFPLELQFEPPDVTVVQLAIQLRTEDPRILPALGAIAREAGNDRYSQAEAAIAAFLLGRQYEQALQLDADFRDADIPEPVVNDPEIPPAA